MAWNVPSRVVGEKITAAIWNYLVTAINNVDNRALVLEALTPVENQSTTSGTVSVATYAASSSGALFAACTVPQSGKVRVEIQCEQWAVTAVGMRTAAAISVSGGSGNAVSNDANSIRTIGAAGGTAASNAQSGVRSWIVSGMTTGATMTATMQHRCETAVTGNFLNRRITVTPVTGW